MKIRQKEQTDDKYQSEKKEFINNAFFILQVHEDQGHQARLEGGNQKTNGDVTCVAAEIHILEPDGKDGKDNEQTANFPDHRGLFGKVFGTIVVVMIVGHGE